jgi:Domain of unknown function (DUF4166)
MTRLAPLPPFVAALGNALLQAAPVVQRHLALPERKALHQGVVRRMWRRGPLGWLGGHFLHLEGHGTADARFELRNEIVPDGCGGLAMRWQRTHYVKSEPVLGVGLLEWDASRGVLIDFIGQRKWLEVELAPSVEGRAVTMITGRQWVRIAGLRVRLPRFLVGGARTREWEEPDGRLGLSLTLHHPLYGDYAGYEAVMTAGDAL